jgi:hypothetical protein
VILAFGHFKKIKIKTSNAQDKEYPSSQFNKSIEIFDYITQITKRKKEMLFQDLGMYQRENHIPINPNDQHNKTHYPKFDTNTHTWWWVRPCIGLCCKTRHPCGAKNRCPPQHNFPPIP